MAKLPGFAKAFARRWRTCGRGGVISGTADRLVGHFCGDDPGFVCERA